MIIQKNMKIIDVFSFKLNKHFIKKLELYNSWFFENNLIYIII